MSRKTSTGALTRFSRRRPAFTLLEALAVVGIISVLILALTVGGKKFAEEAKERQARQQMHAVLNAIDEYRWMMGASPGLMERGGQWGYWGIPHAPTHMQLLKVSTPANSTSPVDSDGRRADFFQEAGGGYNGSSAAPLAQNAPFLAYDSNNNPVAARIYGIQALCYMLELCPASKSVLSKLPAGMVVEAGSPRFPIHELPGAALRISLREPPDAPILPAKVILDPWGQPYHYARMETLVGTNGPPFLQAAGEDGRFRGWVVSYLNE
jgi:type II secretory pathway pseudopilin PulG